MINELFTIGYSPHTLDSFLSILQKYEITAVADVRSLPFSKFKPEFNRDQISKFLKEKGIAYVFLGEYCGARVEDSSCYVNGKVNYELVAENPKFKEGLIRIETGMKRFRIALMCAEKDPINCHRTILVCRNLMSRGINIRHILENGGIEEHKHCEYRLLKLLNLSDLHMFRSEQQRLDDAYSLQGEKIAYSIAESAGQNWGDRNDEK